MDAISDRNALPWVVARFHYALSEVHHHFGGSPFRTTITIAARAYLRRAAAPRPLQLTTGVQQPMYAAATLATLTYSERCARQNADPNRTTKRDDLCSNIVARRHARDRASDDR